MIPGIPALFPHGPYDKDPHFFPTFNVEQKRTDVWEEDKGIFSVLAPEALLLTEPDLWEPYADWCLGKHELSDRDRRRRSNFYCEAIVTLTAASLRSVTKPRPPDEGQEPGVEL